jgi:hypothetical protein
VERGREADGARTEDGREGPSAVPYDKREHGCVAPAGVKGSDKLDECEGEEEGLERNEGHTAWSARVSVIDKFTAGCEQGGGDGMKVHVRKPDERERRACNDALGVELDVGHRARERGDHRDVLNDPEHAHDARNPWRVQVERLNCGRKRRRAQINGRLDG